MTKTMEKLTSSTGATAWIPIDNYASIVLQSGAKFGQLVGKVSLMSYDMGACDGSLIQVKYVRPKRAQRHVGGTIPNSGEITACLSVASTTIGTQAVQIWKFGDYDTIPGFTEFEVCGDLRAIVMEEMSRGLGRRLDMEIYNALQNCHPNIDVETVGVWSATPAMHGSCCTYTFNLYNAIIQAQMNLRGDGLDPDFVIMHPQVSAYLYYKESGSYPDWTSSVKWSPEGVIKSLNGMEVIECQHAPVPVGTSTATVAIIIDSHHAVAEAWGKRPTFSRGYEPECDYTKEVLWAYWGCAAISGASIAGACNGIAHITNP